MSTLVSEKGQDYLDLLVGLDVVRTKAERLRRVF